MRFEFEKTAISKNFSLNLCEKTGGLTLLGEEHVPKYISIMLESISDYARAIKNKETPAAITIEDLKGNLLLAAAIRYHKGEGDMPGSWSYEWAFDEEDIKDCTRYSVIDNSSHEFFIRRGKVYNMTYTAPTNIYLGCQEFANALVGWLDVNAKEGEEVEVELPNYFLASVVVDGGKKVMSFVPEGELKRLIKDDATLEKKAV